LHQHAFAPTRVDNDNRTSTSEQSKTILGDGYDKALEDVHEETPIKLKIHQNLTPITD